MKKIISVFLTFIICLSCIPAFALEAIPTASAVFVDGQKVEFDAYSINGNNYFKLRDLAFVLNGTSKQFDVGYDSVINAITIYSGYPYTVVGGEMTVGQSFETVPTPSSSRIMKDGTEINLTAYLINGNNYFKLRDIGEALNFSVDWDADNNAIMIETVKYIVPKEFVYGYEKTVKYPKEYVRGLKYVWFEAVISMLDTVPNTGTIVVYMNDDMQNEWMAMAPFYDKNVLFHEYDELVGKRIIVCGVYDSYSQYRDKHGIDIDKIYILDTGESKPVNSRIYERRQ